MNVLETIVRESRRKNEAKDCAVRAMAVLTEYDYDDVHYTFGLCGRITQRGTDWHVIEKAAKLLRFEMVDVTNNFFDARTVRTLGRIMRYHRGRYLIRVRGHVLPIVNGTVYDWTKGRLHRILSIHKMVEVTKEFQQAQGRNLCRVDGTVNLDQITNDVTHVYNQVGLTVPSGCRRVYLTSDEGGPVFRAM
jgi:hypothetical protein